MRRSRPMRAAVVQIASATKTAVKSQLPEYQAREVSLALERAGATEIVVRMDQQELCIITYSPEGFSRAKRILGRIPSIKRVYEDTYVDHEFYDEVYCEARYRIAA
jgi:Holliday junction resolvasome RuvABC ATP-dependent DNA helicase subunit